MDMQYATIPLFGGNKRLYREKRLAYVVSNQDNLENYPIYVVDIDLGSSVFFDEYTHADPKVPLQIEFKEDKEFQKYRKPQKTNKMKKDCGLCILMGP